jgi:hypothetical protein
VILAEPRGNSKIGQPASGIATHSPPPRIFIEHSGKLFHIHFHLNNATSLTRGAYMPSSDSEELRGELLSLLDKQLEVLQLSDCVSLTDEEQREYDAREQRIRELIKRLGTLGAAA